MYEVLSSMEPIVAPRCLLPLVVILIGECLNMFSASFSLPGSFRISQDFDGLTW